MAVKVVNCVVCEQNDNVKYKCPCCRAPYCSVKCCQHHKTKGCSSNKVEMPPNEITAEPTPTVKRWKYNFETEDTVPLEKLELLRHSEKLKRILENPHLRKLMETINQSNDAAQLIDNAMREPIFTELSDECLEVIGDNHSSLTDSDDES